MYRGKNHIQYHRCVVYKKEKNIVRGEWIEVETKEGGERITFTRIDKPIFKLNNFLKYYLIRKI